jgi:phosphohistidine phosphatase
MKTLLILRHAKSSWKNDDLADYDRPLKKRGMVDAEKMGKQIEEMELIPQLIISSSANRALKTSRIIADACGYGGRIVRERQLYMADTEDIIQILQKIDDHMQRIMIVGHNPGLEDFLADLTEDYYALPTCALAHVDLSIKFWSEMNLASAANLVNLWVPGQLQ